jgi:regulator of protease activity HflC (stomatin/prohibitin superfamily)
VEPILIWVGIIALVVVITLLAGVKTVPQGQVWTVERLGAFTRALQPGLNLLIPYVDRIGRRMNVQEQVLDVPAQDVITRDNAAVKADGIVYYRVLDPARAAYEVQDLVAALSSLAMTNLRAVVGGLQLDEALSDRARINAALLEVLDGATDPWGVKVSRVEIRNIEPPEALLRAMNMQMTAERERRATIARAEGDRDAEINRAEGAKRAQILEAEGRLEAAKADAQARERLAEAEARAIEMVARAASTEGGAAIPYFLGQKYIDAFAELARNPAQKTLVVPAELSGISATIGAALAGIQALQPGTEARRAAPRASVPQGGAR